MRSNVVFVILLLLMGAMVAGIAMRQRSPHDVPALAPSSSGSASASALVASQSASSRPGSSAAPPPSGGSGSSPKLGRPLRVVSLGWDLLAPGVMANDGPDAGKDSLFKKAGLDVALDAEKDVGKVENALARGGADPEGADIALMPLQRFVASYERLKALKPVMFFIVSWSDGRHVVTSKRGSFDELPAKGEVTLQGVAGDAASFVALFALDLQGTDLDRVKIVDGPATLSGITRREAKKKSEQTAGNLLLTTGAASRLVPYVAIAQAGLIAKHEATLATWARLWLEGQKLVAADASAAARKIAAVKAAPEPLEVLARLSEIAPASLADSAHAAGLAGRGAVTLEALFRRSWKIWRAAKVLTIPPENAPVDGRVIARLVRANTELLAPPSAASEGGADKDKPLLVYRAPKAQGSSTGLDEDKLVDEIGFIAGVFPRSPIRVSVHPRLRLDAKATAALVERTRDRYGLTEGRVVAGKAAARAGATATVEVMPVP